MRLKKAPLMIHQRRTSMMQIRSVFGKHTWLGDKMMRSITDCENLADHESQVRPWPSAAQQLLACHLLDLKNLVIPKNICDAILEVNDASSYK